MRREARRCQGRTTALASEAYSQLFTRSSRDTHGRKSERENKREERERQKKKESKMDCRRKRTSSDHAGGLHYSGFRTVTHSHFSCFFV